MLFLHISIPTVFREECSGKQSRQLMAEQRTKGHACDKPHEAGGPSGKMNARCLRTLVLLLRYSGMRIGDTVSLSVERLNGNKLLLYTQMAERVGYSPSRSGYPIILSATYTKHA